MNMPLPGTREYAKFVEKANSDPNSIEAAVLSNMARETVGAYQEQVRAVIEQAVAQIPGQLFRDVADFHKKFDLKATSDPNHQLPDDLQEFRLKFLLEELQEYAEAVGFELKVDSGEVKFVKLQGAPYNVEVAFDSIIDGIYVYLGTAFLHRFPFNFGWQLVHEANMRKVRAIGADDPLSKRKHSADVVKPPGWTAPTFSHMLGKYAEVKTLLATTNCHILVIVEDSEDLNKATDEILDSLDALNDRGRFIQRFRVLHPEDSIAMVVDFILAYGDFSADQVSLERRVNLTGRGGVSVIK